MEGAGWELPADVSCLIRTTNLKTMKVKEYVYKRRHAAENKVRKLMQRTHTNLLCVLTKQSTTYTQTTTLTTMSKATFNFLLDTLMHEIDMHAHREELIISCVSK